MAARRLVPLFALSLLSLSPFALSLHSSHGAGAQSRGIARTRVEPRPRLHRPDQPDRRRLICGAALALVGAHLAPGAALAKSGVPSRAELEGLVQGYRGIVHLLENWDTETIVCDAFDKATVCSTGEARRAAAASTMSDCSCNSNPGRVQEVMGFKSIKHPLYLADQVMIRAQPLLDPSADFEKYDAAVEQWARSAEDANVMSYTSSWGEANPGGGRDAVLRYLDRSRGEVQKSAELLRSILSALKLL